MDLTFERTEKIKRIYAIALSALTALVGAGYIFAACHLYFTGADNPYSRERVGSYLAALCIPSLILVLGVIGSAIITAITGDTHRDKIKLGASYLIRRAEKNAPAHTLPVDIRDSVRAEIRHRAVYKSVTAMIILISAVAAIAFALDSKRYPLVDLTAEVLSAIAIVFPLAALALGASLICSYLCEASCRRELAVRSDTKTSSGNSKADATVPLLLRLKIFFKKKSSLLLIGARCIIGALAISLVIYGAVSGGVADVLAKAVKICTECIGLG